MKNRNGLDSLDKQMIRLLCRDGRMSVKKIADHLGITSPTVQSRLKGLIESGILKVSGLIDTFKVEQVNIVIVAITIEDDSKMDFMLEKIAEIPLVHCVYAVTGRYDIFIEVIVSEGMESLYKFMTDMLPALGGVGSSESFVVMKTKKKWTRLPQNSHWWNGQQNY
jgi:Lrp/AsnC family transcriptional regulator, regulator for asnA, asnC and gidA